MPLDIDRRGKPDQAWRDGLDPEVSASRGWSVRRSIAFEVALALHGVSGRTAVGEVPEGLTPLLHLLEDDWRQAWEGLFGPLEDTLKLPAVIAWLADACLVDDYSTATRAMRELDLTTALERMTERAAAHGVSADPDLPPPERLVALWSATERAAFESVGLSQVVERRTRQDHALDALPRLLHGGDLHSRFWHLLDRFYYETYAGWRATREDAMRMLENRAEAALGGRRGASGPPALDWLPAQNMVVNIPAVRAAVESGRFEVVFLVEPLGHFDTFILLPDLVVATFAEPGALYARFVKAADDLSTRLKAVADPTRLKLLRLIRHLDLDNTQIAAYLEIARPTVSIHARQLREAGLIETRQSGRQAKHSVRADALRAMFADLERFLDLPE